MNHTYEKTYKNARAVWVAHVVGFIAGLEYFLGILPLLRIGTQWEEKEWKSKYIVYEAYIDDVNKHKKKLMAKVTPSFSEFVFLLIKLVTSLY